MNLNMLRCIRFQLIRVNMKNIINAVMLSMPLLVLSSAAHSENSAALLLTGDLTPNVSHQSQLDRIQKGANLVSRFGDIEKTLIVKPNDSQPVVIAWLLKNGDRKFVLFSDSETNYLWAGNTWDSIDGKSLTGSVDVNFMEKNGIVYSSVNQPVKPLSAPEAILSPEAANQSATSKNEATSTTQPYVMQGKWTGPVPDIIQQLDKLAGVREGNAAPQDTVYLFFDPRCPYCHQAYRATRKAVQQGFSIKWIPTDVLGEPPGQPSGLRLASGILDSNSLDVLQLILTAPRSKLMEYDQKMPAPSQTPDSLSKQVRENNDFLMSVFENHPEIEKKGVPAGLMLDHNTGRPRLVMGLSEAEVIDYVFGK